MVKLIRVPLQVAQLGIFFASFAKLLAALEVKDFD